MSLFDLIFKNRPKEPTAKYEGFFKLLDGYTPAFVTRGGSIYESDLIRSAINARASHIMKLKVEIKGSARPALQTKMKHAPNSFQTWSQFLYRYSTILDVHNVAFVCPIFDNYGQVTGIYTPLPSKCEIVQYDGVPYLRYEFRQNEKAAVELALCGIHTKFQYKNDFFGENNRALDPTIDLIDIQNQGIKEGVKSAATYRFMAKYANFAKTDDLKKERERFTEANFARDANGGGVLLFPNTYNDIKQIDVRPWTADAEQMRVIKDSVYGYFGVNEAVVQNQAFGDSWSAFYEGAIEPFAIQFSEVITKMLFTLREQSQGNYVMATANRLQYMSSKEKLDVSSQLLDRGIITLNEVRDIWNMAPVEDGDVRIIRGEYYNANEKVTEANDEQRD